MLCHCSYVEDTSVWSCWFLPLLYCAISTEAQRFAATVWKLYKKKSKDWTSSPSLPALMCFVWVVTPIIQESTAADINIAVIGIELCKKITKAGRMSSPTRTFPVWVSLWLFTEVMTSLSTYLNMFLNHWSFTSWQLSYLTCFLFVWSQVKHYVLEMFRIL